MSRRARAPREPHCRRCKTQRQPDDLFWRGFCPSCRAIRAAARRKATAERALSRARDAGVEVIDGKTFTKVVLPPKRK